MSVQALEMDQLRLVAGGNSEMPSAPEVEIDWTLALSSAGILAGIVALGIASSPALLVIGGLTLLGSTASFLYNLQEEYEDLLEEYDNNAPPGVTIISEEGIPDVWWVSQQEGFQPWMEEIFFGEIYWEIAPTPGGEVTITEYYNPPPSAGGGEGGGSSEDFCCF